MQIFDTHVYCFPKSLLSALPQDARSTLEEVVKPLGETLVRASSLGQILPEGLAKILSPALIQKTAPVAGLLWDSSPEVWLETSKAHHIEYACLHDYPPFLSRESVKEVCKQHQPGKWLYPESILKEKDSSEPGAFILLVTPDQYEEALGLANTLKAPIIMSAAVLSALPSIPIHPTLLTLSASEPLDSIFETIRNFSNVKVCTSWQPAESVFKALTVLGPGRVVFGSGWPLFGEPYENAIQRVQTALQWYSGENSANHFSAEIFSENAYHLFGVKEEV